MLDRETTTEKSSENVPSNAFSASFPNYRGQPPVLVDNGSTAGKDEAASPTAYEFVDSRELARRLTIPVSWIRDQVRSRSQDPLPHVNFGKYVRFLWGSPALELWIRRRIVIGNNRRLGRTRGEEKR